MRRFCSYPAMLLSLVMLCVSLIWLTSHLRSGAEAIVVRNAMIAELGGDEDFNWSPAEVPKGFKQNQAPPSARWQQTFGGLLETSGAGEFAQILGLGEQLLAVPRTGGSIKSDSLTAYRAIVERGAGYCADYTQVLNAIAYTHDIWVREWGIAFGNFGGGHAFSEVYDSRLNKWVFIDLFFGFYVLDANRQQPLSKQEFAERLAQGNLADVHFERLQVDYFGFRDEQQAWDYYQEGMQQSFLWWGNNLADYEQQPWLEKLPGLPRAVEQMLAIMLGVHPGIRIQLTEQNRAAAEALLALRREFFIYIALGALAFFSLLAQLFGRWRAGRLA